MTQSTPNRPLGFLPELLTAAAATAPLAAQLIIERKEKKAAKKDAKREAAREAAREAVEAAEQRVVRANVGDELPSWLVPAATAVVGGLTLAFVYYAWVKR